MPSTSARVTDAALRAMADRLVNEARIVARELAKHTQHSAARVLDYALLAVVTGVPFGLALDFLKDCGTPENARGRLLMRAAGHSLREMGDKNGTKYKD